MTSESVFLTFSSDFLKQRIFLKSFDAVLYIFSNNKIRKIMQISGYNERQELQSYCCSTKHRIELSYEYWYILFYIKKNVTQTGMIYSKTKIVIAVFLA